MKSYRQIDLDKQDNQLFLVLKVPAWFKVTAFGRHYTVNIDTSGEWRFYKDVGSDGVENIQIILDTKK